MRDRKAPPRKGFILGYIVALIPVFLLALLVVERDTWSETHFSLADQGRSQAFYLAESGLAIAWDAFAASNYNNVTHQSDGSTVVSGSAQLQIPPWNQPTTSTWNGFNITLAGNGWYQWSSTGSNFSYTNSGVPESWTFQVYSPSPGVAKLVCNATYGSYHASHTILGNFAPSLNYALFADGSLSEFVRGPDQNINGPVHSNGNMYFKPSGSVLTINATEVSSQGLMIRSQDAWGRPDAGGTVNIEQTNGSTPPVVNPAVTMNGISQGGTYDSNSANWTSSGASGALQMWQGIVKDQKLGGGYVAPPPVETLQPGGYYDTSASIHIDASTSASYLSKTTFWNESEQETETIQQLDIAALHTAMPGWKQMTMSGNNITNVGSGLTIYATTPIRVVNGSQLFGPLTIASEAPIYVKANFNMQYPTAADWNGGTNPTDVHQPAAVLTSDRIWYLTDGFSDANSISSQTTEQTASTKALYPNQPYLTNSGTTNATGSSTLPATIPQQEVNGLLVDGAPTVTERNLVLPAASNPYYNNGGGSFSNADRQPNGCFPNSDVFLENMGGNFTFKKMGSITHLENAHMANMNQANVTESDPSRTGAIKTSWLINSFYNPPYRNYSYDNRFSNPGFVPPGVPQVFNKTLWQVTEFI